MKGREKKILDVVCDLHQIAICVNRVPEKKSFVNIQCFSRLCAKKTVLLLAQKIEFKHTNVLIKKSLKINK